MVNKWLDLYCGQTVAGFLYFNSPWDVAIGRNSTNPGGDPKVECGGEWSPRFHLGVDKTETVVMVAQYTGIN